MNKLKSTLQSSKFQAFLVAVASTLFGYATGTVDGPTMVYAIAGAASAYIFGRAYEDAHTPIVYPMADLNDPNDIYG